MTSAGFKYRAQAPMRSGPGIYNPGGALGISASLLQPGLAEGGVRARCQGSQPCCAPSLLHRAASSPSPPGHSAAVCGLMAPRYPSLCFSCRCVLCTLHLVLGLGAGMDPKSSLTTCLFWEQTQNPGTLSDLSSAYSQARVGLSDQAFLRVT